MKRYTVKFKEIILFNRWKQKKLYRNGDWTLFGISRWAASHKEYSYKICFFGFEVHVWLEKIFIVATESEVQRCQNCNSTDVKPYRNYLCCYSCGVTTPASQTSDN